MGRMSDVNGIPFKSQDIKRFMYLFIAKAAMDLLDRKVPMDNILGAEASKEKDGSGGEGEAMEGQEGMLAGDNGKGTGGGEGGVEAEAGGGGEMIAGEQGTSYDKRKETNM